MNPTWSFNLEVEQYYSYFNKNGVIHLIALKAFHRFRRLNQCVQITTQFDMHVLKIQVRKSTLQFPQNFQFPLLHKIENKK